MLATGDVKKKIPDKLVLISGLNSDLMIQHILAIILYKDKNS